MEPVIPIEEKPSFLRRDDRPACMIFVACGLCILGLVAATLWGLDRRSKTIFANATSTALAIETQQANVTATQAARSTQQAKYSFVEPFDDNQHAWQVGAVNDDVMRGSLVINGGVYTWRIQEVKRPFYYWAAFPAGDWDKDFDTYVDFKVADNAPDNVCGGFLFRRASIDWEKGAYVFSMCNSGDFYVSYYGQEEWDHISGWLYSDVVRRADWNRLGIHARGSDFTFMINNEIVFEMKDDRAPAGRLLLLVEVSENEPTTLWFDNFSFRHR